MTKINNAIKDLFVWERKQKKRNMTRDKSSRNTCPLFERYSLFVFSLSHNPISPDKT
jgi:hypothetical protein